jgi:hypothetical protein
MILIPCLLKNVADARLSVTGPFDVLKYSVRKNRSARARSTYLDTFLFYPFRIHALFDRGLLIRRSSGVKLLMDMRRKIVRKVLRDFVVVLEEIVGGIVIVFDRLLYAVLANVEILC